MGRFLFEVFARTWLAETGASSLAAIPDAELDVLERRGFDTVWIMGVWTLGKIGAQISRTANRAEFDRLLPGWTDADVVGSPYAIARYAVDSAYGGDDALAELRARLARRGIGLVVDFVPNHTARDASWPAELYVQDGHGLACGKDPYFPPWPDTAQLDHRLAITRERFVEELASIAGRADGVRCDMAMLVLHDIFEHTWRHVPPRGARTSGEFWAVAIDAARKRNPRFVFIAEAYWGLEPRLQRLGFDYTYDKTLYDRLVHGGDVHAHLAADAELHARSLRFLENHDEPRLAELPAARAQAALVIAMTVPGMRFVHDGQREGRRRRMSIHLARRAAEQPDPVFVAMHDRLFELVPLMRGAWKQLGGPFISHRWERDDGAVVVIVNYTDARAMGRVVIDLHGIEGRTVVLRDRMNGAVYERDGTELVAEGLFVVLEAWQAHVFEVSVVGR